MVPWTPTVPGTRKLSRTLQSDLLLSPNFSVKIPRETCGLTRVVPGIRRGKLADVTGRNV